MLPANRPFRQRPSISLLSCSSIISRDSVRTSDFCPGDFCDVKGPPEPNQDLTGSPSRARPKKARGMASGNAPRASRKAAIRRRATPPAMRMPTASFCGSADASIRAPKMRSIRAARPARKAGIDKALRKLLEKPHRSIAFGRGAVILQRLAPAGGVDGDRCQQLAKLPRRASVEMAIGAAREPRDLLESAL